MSKPGPSPGKPVDAALAREFGIPIRFAGIGERPEDLRVFDPEAFVDALLPEALGG